MKRINGIFGLILSLLCIILSFPNVNAQSAHVEPCGFDHVHQKALAQDPAFAAKVQAFEKEYSKYVLEETPRRAGQKAPLVTVPIVFHVIHKGEAVGQGSNITEEQILSSIEGLNIQFRNQNPDGSVLDPNGTDLEFEFCIAQRDPNGNPTNGINRVDGTTVANYADQGIISSNEQQIKALSKWPNTKYYNVWVVAMIDGQQPFGGGTKGYAYFPGASANVDGTVILFNECGYDPDGSRGLKGNGQLAGQSPDNGTMVHEIGHAFSLHHTFNGASSSGGQCPPAEGPGECSSKGDFVCDTDPHESNLGSCKSVGAANSCTGGTYDINIANNYMNYTNCQPLIFTPGQRDRVRFALENQRSYFNNTGTPNACIPVFAYDISLRQIFNPDGFYCDGNVVGEIKVKNNGQNVITSFDIEHGVDGNVLNTYTWSGNLASQDEITVVLPSVSVTTGAHNYFAQVAANSINGSNADEFASNDYLANDFEVIEGSTVTVKVNDFENSDSFEFVDNNGNVIASFSFKNSSGTSFEQDFCLPNDLCYTFKYKDAVFVHPSVGGTPPSYEIIEPENGFTIESGYDSNPFMTGQPYTDQTTEFCMPYDPGFIVADFTVSQTVIPANSTITFYDKSKTADGDLATTWNWNFGDGNTATTSIVNHTYTTPGVYTVTLEADNGILPSTATKRRLVRVVPEITGCDVYNNLIPGEVATHYTTVDGSAGNFPGNNDLNLQEYAERFYADTASRLLYVDLRIREINPVDPSRNFVVKLYDGGFLGDTPGSLLSTERIKLSDLTTGVYRVNFQDEPTVNQFYFISFGTEDPQDEVIVGTAPYRADVDGNVDLSNTAYALSGSSWLPITDIIPEAKATSYDLTPTLSFIPSAEAFSSVQDICAGLTFTVDGSFSENASSYKWIFPANATKPTSSKKVETIAFVEGGLYDIKLVAYGGCNLTDTSTIQVDVDSIPYIDLKVTDDICNQGNGTVKAIKHGGSGANDFVWSHDANYKGDQVLGLLSGNYTYTWSDADCGVSDKVENFTIKLVNKVPEFNTEVEQTTCGFYNGRVSAITDGLSNYQYEWTKAGDATFGSSASGIANLSPGTYTVKVKIAGCQEDRSKTEVILKSDSTLGTVSEIPEICPGEIATISANGGDSLKWFDLSGNLFAGNVNQLTIDTLKTVRLKVVFYGDPGCTLEKITGVTVLPEAFAMAKVTDGNKAYSDSVTVDLKTSGRVLFSSAGTNSQGLKWHFGNGATSTSRNPTYTYTDTGFYEVLLDAYLSGCDDVDTAWVRVIDTSEPVTGIGKYASNLNVSVYPNPTSDILNVTIGKGTLQNNWQIVDLTGKVVTAGESKSEKLALDVKMLNNGVYLIRINNEHGNYQGRFSIVK